MTYAVIMAGGVGTRFWPQSRQSKPKQFLNFFGDRSLLQNTADRIKKLIPADCIYVITNERYTDLVQQHVPDIPKENIIGETIARNTAPCIALAAAIIQKRDPDGTMIVLPSDHHISEPDKFIQVLQTAVDAANQGSNIVTIGIKPHRPETGYGYIQFDADKNHSNSDIPTYNVVTFAEKPDMETAIDFINSGDFLWNSGMFVWRASSILSEIQHHLPQIFRQIEIFKDSLSENNLDQEMIDIFYKNCISISIDYGVMEKAKAVYVVPGDFGWNDVGSWLAAYELEPKDADGNVVSIPHSRLINSSNCFIRSDSDSNKLIAIVGLQGVAVVDTEDALLICRLDASQDVKKVVESLDNSDSEIFK